MTEEEKMLAQLALAKQAQADRESLKTVGGHLYRGFAVPGAVGEDIGQVLPSITKSGLNLGMRGANALLGTQLQPFEPTQWRTPAAVQALLQGGSGAPTTTALAPRPDEHDRTAVPSPAPTPAGPPSWIVNMPGAGGGGGGGRPSQVAAPGAVSQADAYKKELEKILSAAELAKAKDRSNMDATLRGLPADKLMDRLAMFEKMQKDTPLPERAKRTFMDNMRDQAIHGFTGPGGQLNLQGLAANTTAQKVAEDARMKDATQERMRSILEQVGMKALDTGDVNKSQDKKNAITLELAKNSATFDPEIFRVGAQGAGTQSQLAVEERRIAETERQHKATLANASNKQAEALAFLNKVASVPNSPIDKQTYEAIVKTILGAPAMKAATPASVEAIKFDQENFLARAAGITKDNPDAARLANQYAAELGAAIRDGRPPAEAAQMFLTRLAQQYPVRK